MYKPVVRFEKHVCFPMCVVYHTSIWSWEGKERVLSVCWWVLHWFHGTTSLQQDIVHSAIWALFNIPPPDIIIDAFSLVTDRLAKNRDDLAKVWALGASWIRRCPCTASKSFHRQELAFLFYESPYFPRPSPKGRKLGPKH